MRTLKNLRRRAVRNEFVRFLKNKIDEGRADNIAVITGDLGYSVLEPLVAALGPRFINAGVAEASMTSIAAALAADGMKVFTYSITPFATFRCLEQIRNDVCYHNLDVTVVGVGAGFAYGTLGPTHHATEDLAALWALPNLRVYCPGDLAEAKICFEQGFRRKQPQYWRLGKGGEGSVTPIARVNLSNESSVQEYVRGTDLTVICTGTVLGDVYPAVMRAMPGARIQLLTCPLLKPFPESELLARITSGKVLIVEELNPYGGFSSLVSRSLLTLAPRRWESVRVMSALDRFAPEVGGAAFQRHGVGLDQNAVFAQITAMTVAPNPAA